MTGIASNVSRHKPRWVAGVSALGLAIALNLVGVAAAEGAGPGWSPTQVDHRVLAASPKGNVLLKGRLADSSGSPVSGRIAALAWPNERLLRKLRVGDVVARPTVGWTSTGSGGDYSLKVDPALVGADYREPDGTVNVSLIGWSVDSAWETLTSVNLTDGPEAATIKGSKAHPGKADIRLKAKLTKIEREAIVQAALPCVTTLKSTYDADTIIGETWPYGAHTGSIDFQANHQVVLGAAASANGTYGTWSANGTQTKSTNTGDDFGLSSAFLRYWMNVRYGKYQDTGGCFPPYYHENPMYETGGFSTTTLPSTSFPTGWQNCQSAVNIWYRSDVNGNAYSLSGGVQIQPVIGINLSMSTEYTATRKLTYSYPSSSFHVCGDNATPSLASKVRTGA